MALNYTTGNSTTIKYAYYVKCTTVNYSDLHCTTYSKLHNTTINYTKLQSKSRREERGWSPVR